MSLQIQLTKRKIIHKLNVIKEMIYDIDDNGDGANDAARVEYVFKEIKELQKLIEQLKNQFYSREAAE